MNEYNVVAIYDSAADAQATVSDLEAAGIGRDAIEVRAGGNGQPERVETQGSEGGGFLSWLFGDDTAESERAVYRDSLGRGGSVVSVHAPGGRHDEIVAIMERNNPVDIDERSVSMGLAADDGGERTIPLAEERLDVGKRKVEGGKVRIHTRVVETPASEEVRLRDEQIAVERRAPGSAARLGADPFTEKTVELTETREEAVVGKTAHVAEEVVVDKVARERTERVEDTVRRQEVDIEHVDSTGTASPAATRPAKQRI